MNHDAQPRGRQPGPWTVALFAGSVALILRLVYVLLLRHEVIFSLPIMDAAVHDSWARGDATILGIFERGVPYFRAPLYVWFLKLVYAVNESYLAPRLVQVLLASITVSLVADLGRRLAGPMAGLLGGLLLAMCWPAIYFSGELLIVTFFMCLVMLGLWLLVVGTEKDERRWVLVGALVLGTAACARPTALVMAPALVGAPWLLWRHRPESRLGAAPRWPLAVALALLILLPGLGLTVRNKVVGNDWVFIASQGGVNLFIGNNAQADGRTAVVPGTRSSWMGGYEDTRRMAETATGRPLRPSQVSSYFTVRSLEEWRDHPSELLRLYAKKLRYLVGAGERPNNKNLHFWRDRNPLLRLSAFTSWAMIFALGLTGLFLLERRRRAYFLWCFLGLYALGLLPFFINERFRLPLLIVLATFAGIPLARGVAALLQRRYRLALVALLPAAALLVLGTLDRIDFRDDRVEADAFSMYTLGNAYVRAGETQAAVQAYQDALDAANRFRLKNFGQVSRMLHVSMATVLANQLQLDAAQQHLDRALSEGGSGPDTELARATIALRRHDYRTARPVFRSLKRILPDNPDVLTGLAWCLLDQQSFGAAERNFLRVQELRGASAETLAGLGAVELLGNDNLEDARRLLEQSVAGDAETPSAHQYLAELYRREQRLDKMVYHLEEAIRLDPYNLQVKRFYNRLPDDLIDRIKAAP